MVYTGAPRATPVEISIVDYDAETVRESLNATPLDCKVLVNPTTVTWVNVNGVHDAKVIEEIGTIAGLHPLVMEDIVNPNQRPKFEAYDTYAFIELYMVHERQNGSFEIEQVSMVVGPRFVLSFQEFAGEVFAPVIDRIRTGKGNIRKLGADYLAYVLIDTIVDHYFHIVERVTDRMDEIESALLANTHNGGLVTINDVKRDVLHLRRAIWPLREVLGAMERDEDKLFDKKTRIFLRDVHDHIIQVIEILETQRDFLASLTDLYLSRQNQRMNEIMKFLTVVGTIFIPLTFIVGVYGMNFDYMPELRWKLSYPLVLVGMTGIATALIIYFKRKQWL
jgi:magnesium transporter